MGHPARIRFTRPPSRLRLRPVLLLSHDWRDWLFVPLLVQFVVINVLLYPQYASAIVAWGTFRLPASEIFPYTWASSLLLFVYAIWMFHWHYSVDTARTIVYSLALSFAATSLFEEIYQNIGVGQGIGNQSLEGQLINFSAIVFGLSSLRFWNASRVALAALCCYLVVWLLWLAFGYPQIYDATPIHAIQAYVFNASLKVGSFVVIGLFVSLRGDLRNATLTQDGGMRFDGSESRS
jgi:hypothetical protein